MVSFAKIDLVVILGGETLHFLRNAPNFSRPEIALKNLQNEM